MSDYLPDGDGIVANATPDECAAIAPIHAWAFAAGQVDPWPTVGEAEWWTKLSRILGLSMSAKYIFPHGPLRGGK
jgi:hypothetical protein